MVHDSVLRLWQRIATIVIGAALCACAQRSGDDLGEQRLADREAIEQVLARANLGFELSDPDLFANAFAPDAVYELASAATR
jgi:hypothetical protein